MDTINKVELRGRVGNVRRPKDGSTDFLAFSLATNSYIRSQDNPSIMNIETEWHTVIARKGKNLQYIPDIEKGMMVSVLGRIRTSKYMPKDGGEERISYDIIANSIEIVPDKAQ